MLRADTLPASRLADVIAQVDRAAFQRAEQRLAMELFRCGLSFDAPVTDAHFYEDVRPCGPDFIFNAATLFGYSEPAIYSLLSGRIKSLCADRLDVSFGYIGESLSDDARWRTYRQCRCRWRRMQIILYWRFVVTEHGILLDYWRNLGSRLWEICRVLALMLDVAASTQNLAIGHLAVKAWCAVSPAISFTL